jgi:hypothetical protein
VQRLVGFLKERVLRESLRASDQRQGEGERLSPTGASKEKGGALADSAIPCSSIESVRNKVTARQLHRSVRPLKTSIARVTKACAHHLRSSGRRELSLPTNLANQ